MLIRSHLFLGITSTFLGSKCLLLKETNTPTRPRIEPGSPDPESDALAIRPVRPPPPHDEVKVNVSIPYVWMLIFWICIELYTLRSKIKYIFVGSHFQTLTLPNLVCLHCSLPQIHFSFIYSYVWYQVFSFKVK